MPRITKAYTRTGDDGTTGLGNNRRVPKDSLRIEAIGAVDELNANIGSALAMGAVKELISPLRKIQNDLFHLGSVLCVPEKDQAKFRVAKIEDRHVDELERLSDRLMKDLPPLQNFILPGGSPGGAVLPGTRVA